MSSFLEANMRGWVATIYIFKRVLVQQCFRYTLNSEYQQLIKLRIMSKCKNLNTHTKLLLYYTVALFSSFHQSGQAFLNVPFTDYEVDTTYKDDN